MCLTFGRHMRLNPNPNTLTRTLTLTLGRHMRLKCAAPARWPKHTSARTCSAGGLTSGHGVGRATEGPRLTSARTCSGVLGLGLG